MTIDCGRYPNAAKKAQDLLNQDMNALRDYFKEKCTKANSVYNAIPTSNCNVNTAQKAEEDICVLRGIKARLFPQVSIIIGSNIYSLSITYLFKLGV